MTDHVHELTCRGRRRHRSAVDTHMSLTRGRAGTSTWVLRYTVANIGRVYALWSSHVCMKSRSMSYYVLARACLQQNQRVCRLHDHVVHARDPQVPTLHFKQAAVCLVGYRIACSQKCYEPGGGGSHENAARSPQSRGEIGGKYRFPIRIRYLYLFSPISAAGARIAPNENESVTRTRRKIV